MQIETNDLNKSLFSGRKIETTAILGLLFLIGSMPLVSNAAGKAKSCESAFVTAMPSVPAAKKTATVKTAAPVASVTAAAAKSVPETPVPVALPVGVNTAPAAVTSAPAASAPRKPSAAPINEIGMTETINSIYEGSPIYTVVHGKAGKVNPQGNLPGLYRRDQRTWKMLIPGQVMLDTNGSPQITQLAISSSAKLNMAVTTVEGGVYLISGRSDASSPDSFFRFGTDANPLFEVGSMQKRLLPKDDKGLKVSVFQETMMKGSPSGQLVIVSVKFSKPQAVGEGITFAFQVAATADQKMHLTTKPVVIDYDYHESEKMRGMVTTGSNGIDKILYSKILIEQFKNTDLGFFGSHLKFVQEWTDDFVGKVVAAAASAGIMRHPEERVGYNLTSAKVEKDVRFSRVVYKSTSLILEQNYYLSRGRAELVVKTGRPASETDVTLEGKVDLSPNGDPAVWLGRNTRDAVFFKEGVLFAAVRRNENAESSIVIEVGRLSELFATDRMRLDDGIPQDLVFKTFIGSGSKMIERGFIALSGKTANGVEFTGIVKLNFLLQETLKKSDSYPVLTYALSAQELDARLRFDDAKEPLFDLVTPQVESLAAYEQAYDASKPHLNVLETVLGTPVYKFKQPSRTMQILGGVTYAEFTETRGVENPSGLYFNVKSTDITGNETKNRVIGQLLPRPGRAVEENHPENQFFLAKMDAFLKVKSSNREEDAYDFDESAVPTPRKLALFGVDAKKQNGTNGYQLVVAFQDAKSDYHYSPLSIARNSDWLTRLDYFHNAMFLQGRGNDRNAVYLFVSFSAKEEGMTQIYRINLVKPDEVPRVAALKMALTERDLQDQIAFDEEGVPNFILTPDLNDQAHAFSVMDLKTGSKNLPNQAYGPNKKKYKFGEVKASSSGIDDSFVGIKDNWGINVHEVKKNHPHLGRSAELAQFDSFIALGKQLDQMADKKNPAQRMILVVPETLRDLVWDFVLHKAFKGERDHTPAAAHNQAPNRLSHLNRQLSIDMITKDKAFQDQYLANLQNWSKSRISKPSERHFLLSRLDVMMDSGVPMPRESNEGFKLDYVDASDTTDFARVTATTTEHYPSSLYLLAAEKPMQLQEFRNHKAEPSASMLILATPEEMKSFEAEADREIENGLLDHFVIQEIKNPDDESMAVSLAEVFHNSEVQSLEYKFSAKEIKQRAVLDADQSFEVVIDYAVSRFSSLIEKRKTESRFESFMRFRAAFAQAILSDKEVRRTRIVNKYFIERVLTQVFDIPMNLATLPADDPMVLLSRQDAMISWQAAGYSGSFDLKARARDTIVSQTRADSGKSIPSSIILFGNTGSGKTHMFKSLIKMLKLKLWDFNPSANNTDAMAIIINVGQLKEKGGSNRDGDLDVDTALGHLTKLLAMPNGYRSWILFDDVHAASNEVKAKILGWQRSIFEAQDGMYTVMRGEQVVRRPVRNLNIFMTLNPTPDQDQISKYARDKAKPTAEEILLATVSSSAFKVEPSFLRRWGTIIHLDYMPAGAKGPELLKKMAEGSNSLLNTMNRIVLVDPKVVERLVADNEQVDARTFLSASTNALIETASGDRGKGSLVLIVPTASRLSPRGIEGSGIEASASDKISKWVVQHTRTLSLDSSVDGNLAFTKLIVDAFRAPIYESMTLALQEDPRFSGSPSLQRTVLAPVLAAISDHLHNHPYVSANDLNLNASDFGFNTPGEREMFRTALLKTQDKAARALYPLAFKQIDTSVTTWEEIEGKASTAELKNRKRVLADIVLANREILDQRLLGILRVKDLDALPDPTSWVLHLTAEPSANSKVAGRAFIENLWEFFPRIFDQDLVDGHIPGAPELTMYAATRLYLHSIDRAITQMQWARPSRFLLKALELITQDQVLSQKPGVQSFLFTDPNRLIKPTMPDFTFQVIASSQALEDIPKDAREKQRRQFDQDATQYISPTAQ